jgi:hypothetical protein
MASIIIGPGEDFEHRHEGPSKTILKRGKDVKIFVGGTEITMEPDRAVPIAPDTPHRIYNGGKEYCIVDCHHDPASHR